MFRNESRFACKSNCRGPDVAAVESAVRRNYLKRMDGAAESHEITLLWSMDATAEIDTAPNIKLVLPAVRTVLRTILVIRY